MTTIDDRHRKNSQQNDGDPMTTIERLVWAEAFR